MPEGDSLHNAAKRLRPILVAKTTRLLSLPRREESTEGLIGSVIENVEARGENLLVHFDTGICLHVQLKMNGRIRHYIASEESKAGTHSAVATLRTDDHVVVVHEAPVARLVRRRDLFRDFHFRHLGPDLLSDHFDADEGLRLRLRNHVSLGIALLDQGAVAGLGNVWKSEICFNLKLDPFAPVSAYEDQELSALLGLAHRQMVDNVYGKIALGLLDLDGPRRERIRSSDSMIDH